jgi:WD repeat-containing protein mio
VNNGDLKGLLLTGWSTRGIDLLESFIDKTGDLQSACLLCWSIPVPQKDGRLDHWTEW